MGDEKYRIRVERQRQVLTTTPKQWQVIDTQENGNPKYGYTPLVENITVEREDIYEQVVDELNLKAVIDAVNNGSGK